MRIVVTGGAGFIGSNLVDELINLGHEVLIIDNLTTGSMKNVNSKAYFYKTDILEEKVIGKLFNEYKPEICYHLAAQVDVSTSIKDPAYDKKVNIDGTINIINACIENETRRIVFASSAAVYGDPKKLPVEEDNPLNPISFYGASKLSAEKYIMLYARYHNIKYSILRFSNVYGPRQEIKGEGGVVAIFLKKFLNNEAPVIFGTGKQTRDFIYVKDLVDALVLTMDYKENQIINLSSNTSTSILELFYTIRKIVNIKAEPVFAKERVGDILHSRLSNRQAREQLNWSPKYDIEKGLQEMINYLKG